MSPSPPFDFSFAPIQGVSLTGESAPSPLQTALDVLAPLPDLMPAPSQRTRTPGTMSTYGGQVMSYPAAPVQAGSTTATGAPSQPVSAGLLPLVAVGALLVGLAMVIGRPGKRPPETK